MNKVFFLLLAFSTINLYSQNNDSLSDKTDYSKLSMRVSLGVLPMAPKGDLLNSSGKIGTLELMLNVSRNLYFGAYATNMIHYESYELVLIDDKIIDLNSSEYGNFGLNIGYRIFNSKRIVITPEVKGGLALYTAKSISFPENNKSFIDRKSLIVNPNLTIGAKVSDKFIIGINGGYQLLINTLKGPEMDYFNPSTLNYGLSVQLDI